MKLTHHPHLVTRAEAAYHRADPHHIQDQPSPHTSSACDHQGRRYVVLANGLRTLAVYQYFPNTDRLRRLETWPGAIR